MSITTQNYISTVRKLIEQRLKFNWVDSGNAELTPISWPAAPLDQPKDKAWLRLSILHGESFNKSIARGQGDGLNKNTGSIQLQIFAPKGRGTGAQLDSLTDVARSIFNNYAGAGLECGASSPATYDSDAAYIISTVTTPFYVWETSN